MDARCRYVRLENAWDTVPMYFDAVLGRQPTFDDPHPEVDAYQGLQRKLLKQGADDMKSQERLIKTKEDVMLNRFPPADGDYQWWLVTEWELKPQSPTDRRFRARTLICCKQQVVEPTEERDGSCAYEFWSISSSMRSRL